MRRAARLSAGLMATTMRWPNSVGCATPLPTAPGIATPSIRWSNYVFRRMPSRADWRSSGLRTVIRTTPPVPSRFDADHAWSFYSYVVASVQHGTLLEARSWRLDSGGVFQEEPLTETA